jgi:CBS domain-containing protein
MTAQKHLDFRKALTNPRAEFGNPERLLADPRLDREGKRAILRSWQQDERELEVAEEEGMGDGERSMLHRVAAALDSISGRADQGPETATKHGGRDFAAATSSATSSATSPGATPEARRVADLMRPIDEVVHLDQDLHEAHVRMRRFQTSFLPVVDGDEIVGLLTAGDVPRNVRGDPRPEASQDRSAKVRDHLTKDIAFCYRDDDLETAQAVIRESGHRRLLVTDREHQLVGLITEERLAAASGRRRPSGPRAAARPEVEARLAKRSGRATGSRPGRIVVYAVKPKLKT